MILALLFALFNFLFSMWGLTCFLIGIALFLGLPVISTVSRFKSFSGFFFKMASLPLRRAAFVVSEHNDILFKQMRFDSLGVEMITLDGEEKPFEDPDAALHTWLGIPFALANEEHGVLFDPRHAALGKRKKEHEDRGEGEYDATEEEWDQFGVSKWKPGVFEFPKKHELVNLRHVVELIDGGERAEYAGRVEELYQHSRAPLQSGSSGIKYLMPILAFGLTFGGIWVMASQIGGPDSTVSYTLAPVAGTLAMLPFLGSSSDDDPLDESDDSDDDDSLLGGIWETLTAIDWRLVIGVFLLITTPVATIGLLFVFLGLAYAFVITATVLLGMLFLPFITIIAQASTLIGGALSKLYFRLGFLGYRKPVLEWTPEKYQLREYDQLETTDDVQWYDGFGGLLGFTYQPDASSWDAEVIQHQRIESQQPVTDGGKAMNSNLPAGKVPASQMKRDKYGGYVPTRVRDDCYYLRTGIALNRFSNSAVGEKSLRKLLEAKEKYGANNDGIDDSTVFKATLVSGALGAIGGIAIFILPAFL